MRILMTGGAGFVGGALHHRLAGHEVYTFDLADGQDVCNPADVADAAEFEPQVVFHLAAHHFIPWCNEHPNETMQTNLGGTDVLLRTLPPTVVSIVFASSAAVYGFADTPRKERHKTNPIDIYGLSKELAESRLHNWSREHPEVRCVSARLFNIVGHGDPWPHLVPSVAKQAATGTVRIGNPWPKRDYIHVSDAVTALERLANGPMGYHVFNVGTGIPTTVEMVVRLFGAKPVVDEKLVRPDDGHLVADNSKLMRLGWTPEFGLMDAVRQLEAA